MDYFQTAKQRISAEFPTQYILHRDLSYTFQENPGNEKQTYPVRILSIENPAENYFHAALVIQEVGKWLMPLLSEVIKQVEDLRNMASFKAGNAILGDQLRSTASAVFSHNLYVYISQTHQQLKEEISAFALTLGLNLFWRDDVFLARWQALHQGEIFLCHDSSDKPFVEMLYNELVGRGVSPWLDKSSLQLGDSLVNKINDGLKNCEHAVFVISPAFLKNKAWARREFRGYLNLWLKERKEGSKERKLFPIWRGVSQNAVMEYDLELPDIFATQASLDKTDPEEVQKIAQQIARAMRS